MTDNQILAKELLTFFRHLPKQILEKPDRFRALTCISLGNGLLSASYSIEKGQPQIYQHLNEPAESLFALGKQFREVGLKLWDEDVGPKSEFEALLHAFASIQNRVIRLESFHPQPKGGSQ